MPAQALPNRIPLAKAACRKGHQAEDRLLRSLSAAWPEVLRDTDFLGRLGGDEFGLILPRCAYSEAEEVLTRIERAVPDVPWSAGLATFVTGDGLDDLVRRADAALYRAKAAGLSHTTLAHA